MKASGLRQACAEHASGSVVDPTGKILQDNEDEDFNAIEKKQLKAAQEIATPAINLFFKDVDRLFKEMQKPDYKDSLNDHTMRRLAVFFGEGNPLTKTQVEKVRNTAELLRQAGANWNNVYIRPVRGISPRHKLSWNVGKDPDSFDGQAFPRLARSKDKALAAAPDFILTDNSFKLSPEKLATVLIYEVSHAFDEKIKDYGYFQSISGAKVKSPFEPGFLELPNWSRWDFQAKKFGPPMLLSTEKSLANADSYAHAIWFYYILGAVKN